MHSSPVGSSATRSDEVPLQHVRDLEPRVPVDHEEVVPLHIRDRRGRVAQVHDRGLAGCRRPMPVVHGPVLQLVLDEKEAGVAAGGVRGGDGDVEACAGLVGHPDHGVLCLRSSRG